MDGKTAQAQSLDEFVGQGWNDHADDAEARGLLDEALGLAAYGPTAKDPAARSLAVTGNNLASTLESTANRTPAQTALMVRAAEIGLRFWSLAGGPFETALAHYRLSR